MCRSCSNTDGSYTFYTRGVDRITDFFTTVTQSTTGIVFYSADALWESFQNSINNFVLNNHGISDVEDPQILRPDWQTVIDVLNGTKPLSTLSKLCP